MITETLLYLLSYLGVGIIFALIGWFLCVLPNQKRPEAARLFLYVLVILIASMQGWYRGCGHAAYGQNAKILLLQNEPFAIAGMSMRADQTGAPEYYYLFLAHSNNPPTTVELRATEIAHPENLKIGDVRPVLLTQGKWDFKF